MRGGMMCAVCFCALFLYLFAENGGKLNMKMQNPAKRHVWDNLFTLMGTVLCILLIPVLTMNIALIVKSYVNPDEVPGIGGYFPLIVLTDSMYPEIESGDLIISHAQKTEEIEVGDVISFKDPAGNGSSIVTHRVMDILDENGKKSFVTKGDANNSEDAVPVPEDNLLAVYQGRIAGAGNLVMHMQTTEGLLAGVVLPILLMNGYDFIRRKIYHRSLLSHAED